MTDPYTIVVGVSGTSKSPAALEWAAAQAGRTGGRLIAVRAWRTPAPAPVPSGPTGVVPRPGDDEQMARQALVTDVAEALGADHGAELRLVRGRTFAVLMEACEGADLLVVDAPRQLIAGPMFAHRLVYAAPCPVVVMPPRFTDNDEPEGPAGSSRVARVGGAVAGRLMRAAGTAGRAGYRPPPKL